MGLITNSTCSTYIHISRTIAPRLCRDRHVEQMGPQDTSGCRVRNNIYRTNKVKSDQQGLANFKTMSGPDRFDRLKRGRLASLHMEDYDNHDIAKWMLR